MAAFSGEAVVRGYHVYKDIWTVIVGEEFYCQRESGNRFNFKISYVKFSYGTHFYEILHPTKISRYTGTCYIIICHNVYACVMNSMLMKT